MKKLLLTLLFILIYNPLSYAGSLEDLKISNILAQLNLDTTESGNLNVEVWENNIEKLENKELKQQWYNVLLGQLNLNVTQGGSLEVDLWENYIQKLSDKELQQQWKMVLNSQKVLKSISN